jgi:hypothetical protein
MTTKMTTPDDNKAQMTTQMTAPTDNIPQMKIYMTAPSSGVVIWVVIWHCHLELSSGVVTWHCHLDYNGVVIWLCQLLSWGVVIIWDCHLGHYLGCLMVFIWLSSSEVKWGCDLVLSSGVVIVVVWVVMSWHVQNTGNFTIKVPNNLFSKPVNALNNS